jgi:hypothetical protein
LLLGLTLFSMILIPSNAVSAKPSEAQEPAKLIISEFRLRGPNGASDEFVEIYNTETISRTVSSVDGSSGFALAASDGVTRFVIPNGTVIPAGGHYLGVNSTGYSLSSYPAGHGTTATGDASFTLNIADNAGIALFRTSTPANFTLANRLDAVGSTAEANTIYKEGPGYPSITPFSIDYSFYRNLLNGSPKDTNVNSTDFLFVDTNGTSAGAGQRLGAPGPENLSSPIGCCSPGSSLTVSLIDPNAGVMAAPNFVRDLTSDPAHNSTYGTISIRRKFTNTGSQPITRLRFRVTDITTFPSPSGVADLRPLTSSAVIVSVNGSNVSVTGTTLEQPPTQVNGGGFNSTFSVGAISPAASLAPGASVYVQFTLGLQQSGCERLELDVPINYDTCTPGIQIAANNFTCTGFTASGTGTPASGYAGMQVWRGFAFGPAVIDSFNNIGVPAAYAAISPNGSYRISMPFSRQSGVLVGRIYRATAPTFGSWDNAAYQDVTVVCPYLVYLPLILR